MGVRFFAFNNVNVNHPKTMVEWNLGVMRMRGCLKSFMLVQGDSA
jgi:hypothetical protein